LTVATNGILDMAFQSAAGVLTGVITNHGMIAWLAGSYPAWVFYEGRLANMTDGLLDMRVDGQFHRHSLSSLSHVSNVGVIRKSTGTGTAFFSTGVELNNTGLIDVQGGGMDFNDGFTSSGTFNVTNGASLDLHSGTFHLQPGHRFTGGGDYGVLEGSATIDGPIAETNFQFTGSTLAISNQLTGTLHWTSGTLVGELTVAANGILDMAFQSSAGVLAGVVTNHGRVVWPAGSYAAWVFYDGRFENMTDGLLEMRVDGQFARHPSGSTAQINNAGVICKSVGTGLSFFGATVGLQNNGLLDVRSGTMQLPGNSLKPGSRLNCGLGSLTDYGRFSFSGSGVLDGTLSASLTGGFEPAPGAQFQAVSGGSLGGGFTAFSLPDHFIVKNSSTSVTLSVGGGDPVTITSPAFAGTNFTFAFQSEAGLSYTVQSNDDLGTTHWNNVQTIPGDGLIKQFLATGTNVPQRFFRVRQP
jgi:hypothetical protein